MTTTAICVPRWPDGGRRDEIWNFLHPWITQQMPYPVFVGENPGPGEARAAAATQVGDADTIVFWDADTLAHPDAVAEAIHRSSAENRMVLACDSHMYMSQDASDRILAGGLWFPRPYSVERGDRDKAMYARPCSGVYAIPRRLYDACGGYPAVGPNGYEDLIWFQLTAILSGNGPEWVNGHITLHLWHPPAERTQPGRTHPETTRNRALWQQLARLRTHADAISRAREILATVGHEIP